MIPEAVPAADVVPTDSEGVPQDLLAPWTILSDGNKHWPEILHRIL